MYAIMRREFLSLFKSFKSIAVVAFFLLVSFYISKYISGIGFQLGSSSSSPYVIGIGTLVLLFGFLFGLTLSHDTINREMESQTIRYLVPKTRRLDIIIGKYLGIFLFWVVSITLSFLIISFYAKHFYIMNYLQLLSFMSYVISVTFMLSFFVKRSTYSMFLSVILGLFLPAIGFYVTYTESFWQYFKYLFPYFYLLKYNGLVVIPFLLAAAMLALVLTLFQRSDL